MMVARLWLQRDCFPSSLLQLLPFVYLHPLILQVLSLVLHASSTNPCLESLPNKYLKEEEVELAVTDPLSFPIGANSVWFEVDPTCRHVQAGSQLLWLVPQHHQWLVDLLLVFFSLYLSWCWDQHSCVFDQFACHRLEFSRRHHPRHSCSCFWACFCLWLPIESS